MRPAERQGLLSSWIDSDIEPDLPWEYQLVSKLEDAKAALFLVSPSLLKSQYIRKIEIPAFIKRIKSGNFHLFCVLLEVCAWQELPELQQIQALGSTKTSISESPTKSDEQCRLVDIVNTITKTVVT